MGRAGRAYISSWRSYWVPEHVRAWLRGLGFLLPLEDMKPHIRAWDE